MDPNETLKSADQAISDCDATTAREFLDYYRQWRARGGFEPHDAASSGKRGDDFARECERRLHSLVRCLAFISDREAVAIMRDWHSGQWSALYAAQSSGLVKSWSDLASEARDISDAETRRLLGQWIRNVARRCGPKIKNAIDGKWYYSLPQGVRS